MGSEMCIRDSGETDREWGEPIEMTQEIKNQVDELWDELDIL